MLSIRERMDQFFETGDFFKDKIEKLIDIFLQETILYPYRKLFVITELNSKNNTAPGTEEHQKMQVFLNPITEEMKAGN